VWCIQVQLFVSKGTQHCTTTAHAKQVPLLRLQSIFGHTSDLCKQYYS